MKTILCILSASLLTACAGSFAWEDPSTSTHSERVRNAQDDELLVEQQLNHQLSDGSISLEDYNNLIKANRDYANSIQ